MQSGLDVVFNRLFACSAAFSPPVNWAGDLLVVSAADTIRMPALAPRTSLLVIRDTNHQDGRIDALIAYYRRHQRGWVGVLRGDRPAELGAKLEKAAGNIRRRAKQMRR